MKKGFTLVELLVVIAILLLLSSVVLTSLRDSRFKAQNAKINLGVMEYSRILELYKLTYNKYPLGIDSDPICLGQGYGGTWGDSCGEKGNEVSSPTDPLLSELLTIAKTSSLLPISTSEVKQSNGGSFIGAVYSVSGDGTTAQIKWWLNKENQSCAKLANFDLFRSSSSDFGVTECIASQKVK